jgi:hypothetical protein
MQNRRTHRLSYIMSQSPKPYRSEAQRFEYILSLFSAR